MFGIPQRCPLIGKRPVFEHGLGGQVLARSEVAGDIVQKALLKITHWNALSALCAGKLQAR
ncbi:MAG TPA: hypothetical protein VGO90_12090 [Chthoniobacteraceae bacterium]|nr:hypothetical protein [Chthoniobacteraceae bacterium]